MDYETISGAAKRPLKFAITKNGCYSFECMETWKQTY